MPRDARRNRVAAWALAAVLFALGVAVGIAGDRVLLGARPRGRPGPPTSAVLVERLTRELDLTDAQARTVRGILDERWDALGRLSARFEPEADAIRRAADDRLRAVLEPAQRERYERHVAEREQRREQRRAELRRGAGAGPP
jgi:hypothetical protein